MMLDSPVVSARDLSFHFGRTPVFEHVTLDVPRGAFYALLGPNGAGKTTLMQLLMGIRRSYRGSVTVLGRECASLRVEDRQRMGYVAEGLKLPAWMRLEQLEAYLAPLYPSWDYAHASNLRERFELDPKVKISKLSRGNYMKAALLCALAPRPELLILDEPFTGMDVSVKDELVSGLLAASAGQNSTIFLASHDIGELELLADWVGFIGEHSMKLSEPIDVLRARFKHVDVMLGADDNRTDALPSDWMSVEQVARHLKFVASSFNDNFEQRDVRARFPDASRVEVREATLKEVFVALQRSGRAPADSRQPAGR